MLWFSSVQGGRQWPRTLLLMLTSSTPTFPRSTAGKFQHPKRYGGRYLARGGSTEILEPMGTSSACRCRVPRHRFPYLNEQVTPLPDARRILTKRSPLHLDCSRSAKPIRGCSDGAASARAAAFFAATEAHVMHGGRRSSVMQLCITLRREPFLFRFPRLWPRECKVTRMRSCISKSYGVELPGLAPLPPDVVAMVALPNLGVAARCRAAVISSPRSSPYQFLRRRLGILLRRPHNSH